MHSSMVTKQWGAASSRPGKKRKTSWMENSRKQEKKLLRIINLTTNIITSDHKNETFGNYVLDTDFPLPCHARFLCPVFCTQIRIRTGKNVIPYCPSSMSSWSSNCSFFFCRGVTLYPFPCWILDFERKCFRKEADIDLNLTAK